MTAVKTIVAAIDFSDVTSEVVRMASAVADPAHTRLHLLTVVPDPVRQAWTVEAPALDFEAIHERWRNEAEARMAKVHAEITLPPGQVSRAVVTGIPDKEIVRYAREKQVDLIVMGTHGYGPLKRFFLGSVADRVLRQAPCPVLTVPPAAVAHAEHAGHEE
jgi:nucleotide-binding universal stress UspA family protein